MGKVVLKYYRMGAFIRFIIFEVHSRYFGPWLWKEVKIKEENEKCEL
jgi:hypothetical protein